MSSNDCLSVHFRCLELAKTRLTAEQVANSVNELLPQRGMDHPSEVDDAIEAAVRSLRSALPALAVS